MSLVVRVSKHKFSSLPRTCSNEPCKHIELRIQVLGTPRYDLKSFHVIFILFIYLSQVLFLRVVIRIFIFDKLKNLPTRESANKFVLHFDFERAENPRGYEKKKSVSKNSAAIFPPLTPTFLFLFLLPPPPISST